MKRNALVFVLLILSAFYTYAQERSLDQVDPQAEAEELFMRAKAGDVQAQTKVATILYNAKDYKNAFEWFFKAANQGYAPAQNNMGILYKNGEGVQQDFNQAFQWFTKAANQNNPYAQNSLGLLYLQGAIIPQDHKQAFEWFLKAANQGYSQPQYNLGVMYLDGRGIPKDIVTGCAWMYISKDIEESKRCDTELTPNQMTRTLKLKDELLEQVAIQ
jgi:TPR repeat protein